MTRQFTLDPARLKASCDMFAKLLDDVDKFSEQLREDLCAPRLSKRFAHATSVQLTLLDITDNEALAPQLRDRAAEMLKRIEAHDIRQGEEQH